MAMTQTLPLSARLYALRDDVAHRYAQYRAYRRTLNELKSLSTRELADLGLNPSMLRGIAREAADKI